MLYKMASLSRMQLEQIGIGQLHWSTAKYAPLQESALWDGLVAMYEEVSIMSAMHMLLIYISYSLIALLLHLIFYILRCLLATTSNSPSNSCTACLSIVKDPVTTLGGAGLRLGLHSVCNAIFAFGVVKFVPI